MFSLVLVVISIGLVGLAGFSVLYLTGSIFKDAGATGGAAALNSQAQQLLQAADSFREDNGRWPLDVPELISRNYLRGNFMPIEGAEGVWLTPLSGTPVYLMREVPDSVCEELNGQLSVAHTQPANPRGGLWLQCYGEGTTEHGFKVVVSRGGANLTAALNDPAAFDVLLDTAP